MVKSNLTQPPVFLSEPGLYASPHRPLPTPPPAQFILRSAADDRFLPGQTICMCNQMVTSEIRE